MSLGVLSKVILTIGIICCIVGAIVYGLFPNIIKSKVKQNLVIKEGTSSYNHWVSPIVPIYMKIYLFNVTNPDEIVKGKKSPRVAEMGPYVYREYRKKDVIRWSKDDTVVTYREKKVYYFQPDLSTGSEDDIVVTVNMPIVGIVQLASDSIPTILKSVSMPLVEGVLRGFGETLFIRKTVKELLFQGYKVDLVERIDSIIRPFVPNFIQFLPNNSFGLLYGKNNSDEGIMSVYTGAKDMKKYLSYHAWNGKTSLQYWNGNYCNMINGTDGRGFSPFLKRSDTLYIFIPDICRSVPLIYEDDVSIKGITAYRYILSPSAFQDTTSNPDNKCFYRRNVPSINGIFPVSVCQKGRPVYVSSPHFYKTDERIRKKIKGLSPRKEKHQTFIDIEPTIGTTFRVSGKLQFNLEILQNPYISFLSSVSDIIMPVFWLDQTGEITENAKDKFTSQVTTPMIVGRAVLISVMVLGVIWIFVSVAVILWNIWKKAKPKDGKVIDMNMNSDTSNKMETKPKFYDNHGSVFPE
ncbi:lysosome membrane protein 2-like isoform X2 [Centruroides sculpturatus]|uniref:lysosome membrane protein 2-like isoform X2 n=1 Tax=Centruroides sculpturatus TaxID=218467 RepID=UPI000C6DE549|nr:lysosome membrane protein 2-like isoform X2 [Centruroides sculpturatus]